MHVPFGWVALVAGVIGGVLYVVFMIRGGDADFALLAASLAAFVAGWIACVSIPRLERQIKGAQDGRDRTTATTPTDPS